MRSLTLSILASLFTLLSFGQSTSENATNTQTAEARKSVMFLNNENPQTASAQTADYNYDFNSAYARGSDGSCSKFKKMKTTGIILASVGGGLLIGGAVMYDVAVVGLINGNIDGPAYYGLIGGGVVLIIGGVACIGAGVPLAIIGSIKARKNCGGGGRASLNLHSGRNGTGLALNF